MALGLLRLLDRMRGLFLPFGLFAVVAVGIHAGSDRVDDLAYLLYNQLDAWADQAATGLLSLLGDLLSFSARRVDAWTYWAVDLINLETKGYLARLTALGVELGADLILALPVFLGRKDGHSLERVWRHLRADPTLLRVVAPVSAGLAGISGILVIARELQAVSFGALDRFLPVSVAGLLARGLAAVALVLVAARLALPIFLAAARWADLQAEQDVLENRSTRARRMRGWLTALVALPVTFLAAFEATPLLGTLRSIFLG